MLYTNHDSIRAASRRMNHDCEERANRGGGVACPVEDCAIRNGACGCVRRVSAHGLEIIDEINARWRLDQREKFVLPPQRTRLKDTTLNRQPFRAGFLSYERLAAGHRKRASPHAGVARGGNTTAR